MHPPRYENVVTSENISLHAHPLPLDTPPITKAQVRLRHAKVVTTRLHDWRGSRRGQPHIPREILTGVFSWMGPHGDASAMSLTFKETRAISGLADVLYDFLPGSGHANWKGHVNFGTIAKGVGVGQFWPCGSKKPAIVGLRSSTLDQERSLFQKLIVELVRADIVYREKQRKPVKSEEIDQDQWFHQISRALGC